MYDWIGCGPSAASQFNGHRYRNPSSIKEWLKTLKSSTGQKEDEVLLSPELLFADSLIFGLRMNEGICFDALVRRFSSSGNINTKPYLNLLSQMEAEGYLKQIGSQFILTREGQLKCDGIGLELLNLSSVAS